MLILTRTFANKDKRRTKIAVKKEEGISFLIYFEETKTGVTVYISRINRRNSPPTKILFVIPCDGNDYQELFEKIKEILND